MITTEWFFGEEGLTDALSIRRAVFIEEQGIEEALELDGTDYMCIHLVAYDDDEPAATGRIVVAEAGGDFKIGRVAVLPAFRGRGIGFLIMQMLVHACYTMGSERQVVHAQLSVRGFYERLGFMAYGDPFDEAGVPHIHMAHEGDMSVLCQACR